nr:hypothetical protein EATA8330_38770 [Enterobacter asburiae]
MDAFFEDFRRAGKRSVTRHFARWRCAYRAYKTTSQNMQTKKRRLSTSFFWNIGTEDGTRTHKPVRALPPQGSVSTNSTTSVQNT